MKTPLTVHPLFWDNNSVEQLYSWHEDRVARPDTTQTLGKARGKTAFNVINRTPVQEISQRMNMRHITDVQDQRDFRRRTNPAYYWSVYAAGASPSEQNTNNHSFGFGVQLEPPAFDDDLGQEWQNNNQGILVQRYNYDLLFTAGCMGLGRSNQDEVWYRFICARGGIHDRKNSADALYVNNSAVNDDPHRFYSLTNSWIQLPFNNYNNFMIPQWASEPLSSQINEYPVFMRAHGVIDVALSRDVGVRGRPVQFAWTMHKDRNSTPPDDFTRYGRDYHWQFSVTREPKPIVMRQPYVVS